MPGSFNRLKINTTHAPALAQRVNLLVEPCPVFMYMSGTRYPGNYIKLFNFTDGIVIFTRGRLFSPFQNAAHCCLARSKSGLNSSIIYIAPVCLAVTSDTSF